MKSSVISARLIELTEKRTRFVLGIVLVVAFSLRVHSILALNVTPTSDASEFHRIAQNLLDGKGYALDDTLTASRPPAYPMFLAAIYLLTANDWIAGQIAQALLETTLCLLLFLLGRKLYSPTIGLVAAAFWASYPPSILYANSLLSEPLFTCFVLASFIVLFSQNGMKTPMLALVGLLWGLATLTRPFFVFAPLVFGIWITRNKQSLLQAIRASTLVFVVTLIVISPWIYRNTRVIGMPVLDTNAGVNLWMGNNSNATGAYYFPKENNPLIDITDEVRRDRLGFSLALAYIKSNPLHCILLVPKKIAYLWSSESHLVIQLMNRGIAESGKRYADLYIATPPILHVAVNVHYVFFVICGILGLFLVPENAKAGIRMVMLLIGYWIAVHAIFVGLARYHHPLMPLFILTAAYSFLHLPQIWHDISVKKKLIYMVLTAVFFSILVAEVTVALIRGVP